MIKHAAQTAPAPLSEQDDTVRTPLACSQAAGRLRTPDCWNARLWRALPSLRLVGGPLKTFSMPPKSIYQSPDVRWMPDSQSLIYVATRDGVSNVWKQPLAGGPPKQLTTFLVDTIFYFDVSPNGKRIVSSRGGWTHDMILIKTLQ